MSDRTASLRALIQDRKSKDIRRTYTHTFCINPDLVIEYRVLEAELKELQKELDALPKTDDSKPANTRMAGGPRATLEKSIKEKEGEISAKQTEIEAVAVKIRFKSMKNGRFSEMIDDWEVRKATTQVKFHETLLETFDRFVDPDDMTKDDFVKLLEVFDEGEYYEAASTVQALMANTVDVPKFAKPSTGRQK